MKKLFTILTLMTLTVVVFAQAPQTFSYQTVIRDNNWQAVSNQDVSIEIAIIEDVASGTVVYKEVHDPTTNELGLVNLAIGSGGVMQGNWTNIDWGNHTYFIEVAVDVTGGTSYIVMGTTQLRSVPYALYAENSGSSTPGPQGLQGIQGLPGDTGATGPQGPIGLTGAQGIQGIQGLPGNTGPQGLTGNTGPQGATGPQGLTGVQGPQGVTGAQGPIGLTGPQGIQGPAGNDGIDGADGQDGIDGVDGAVGAQGPIGLTGPQGIQGPAGNDGTDGVDGAVGAQGPIGLTGPQGIQGPAGNDGIDGADGQDGIDGVDGAVGAQGPIGLTGPQGIQGPVGNDGIDGQDGIDGIDAVIDYDSLANLISVDSTFITNVGGEIGGGCDPNFPDGFNNIEPISWSLISSNQYTVPTGKNLYIVSAFGYGSYGIFVDGLLIHSGNELADENYLIFGEGDVLTNNAPGGNYFLNFNGFLVDKIIEPISFSLTSSNPYTVPAGKNLYIVSAFGYGSYGIFADGLLIHSGNELADENYLIFGEGDVLTNNAPGGNNFLNFNGYLVDEDYFAGCGGGEGSSSSNNGLDSATVAAMIASAVSISSGSSVPTGSIQAYSGTTAPNGWLLCDGSTVSRTIYTDLYAIIDTSFGLGDGSYTLQWVDSNNDGIMQPNEMINIPSTFNLPDLRGRTIIGLDNMGGIPANVVSGINSLGVIGGSETHTLTTAEMPSHNHSFYAVGSQGTGNHNDGGTSNAIGNTFITTSSEGGDQPHNNMQPYLSLNYIIKY